MVDRIKDASHPDYPMRSPASAAKLLAEMRAADPLTALNDLGGWLETAKATPGREAHVRSEILSMILEWSEAHVSALLAQYLARAPDTQAMRESSWKTLVNYLTALTGAMHTSARVLLNEAAANAQLHPAAAVGAARCLHACRTLAKACLVRYLTVPPNLWRLAYAVHDSAEKMGCAATPVRLHPAAKKTTSVTQELLRLLMLHSSAPQMMSPAQIEVADRVTEQLAADFTLRPRGVADNPFCFDPPSDLPPRRAAQQAAGAGTEVRYFGAGTGLDALEQLYKQLVTTNTTDIKAFGRDIAPYAQISAIEHLLAFWAAASPYSPPAHSPATGELAIMHRYAAVWQHLSQFRSAARLLTLIQTGDGAPPVLEMWTLHDAGGNELGAEIPQASSQWAQCGDLVSVSPKDKDECWLGVIRSMHAERGHCAQANIAILSRDPQAVDLHVVVPKGEETMYSPEAARQFDFNHVRAIIVSDGSGASQKPNFLLPPDSWKAGRVYELTLNGSTRYLRAGQRLRRGDDYVRATFEWLAQP